MATRVFPGTALRDACAVQPATTNVCSEHSKAVTEAAASNVSSASAWAAYPRAHHAPTRAPFHKTSSDDASKSHGATAIAATAKRAATNSGPVVAACTGIASTAYLTSAKLVDQHTVMPRIASRHPSNEGCSSSSLWTGDETVVVRAADDDDGTSSVLTPGAVTKSKAASSSSCEERTRRSTSEPPSRSSAKRLFKSANSPRGSAVRVSRSAVSSAMTSPADDVVVGASTDRRRRVFGCEPASPAVSSPTVVTTGRRTARLLAGRPPPSETSASVVHRWTAAKATMCAAGPSIPWRRQILC
mmetsp:Transcript_10284/g.41617  ORF Transcript_10284/g.41617 Transcript_10284/m.41617 type:complete len:301 (+) Transcript_10284:2869-3771(+)